MDILYWIGSKNSELSLWNKTFWMVILKNYKYPNSKMRVFSHYTKDSYLRKTKEIVKYFGKPMRQVTTKELRYFLLKYLRGEKQIGERSVNYYNSVIRFIYDVVLDYPINHKQLPMYKKKRKLPKILSEEELNVFFKL